MRLIEKFVNENENECIETYEDWQADIEASHCNATEKDSFEPEDRNRQRVIGRPVTGGAAAPRDKILADFADIGNNIKLNIVREQERKLIPVLARVMDAALRLEYYKFQDAARFVLKTIREELGGDVADQLTIDYLQGTYISMSTKYRDRGADSKKDVVSIASLDKIKVDAEKSANTQLKCSSRDFI